MRSLSLTTTQLDKLTKEIYDYGSESLIIKSGHNTLYKVIKDNPLYCKEENLLMKENKYQKIKKLYNIKDFNNLIKILGIITVNGNFTGYEMSYNENYITLFNSCLDTGEKIKYLSKIKEKLLYFESLGIIYADIKSDNILINPKDDTVGFCDLDNIWIDNYQIDCSPRVVSEFFKRVGCVDNRIHSYMHNLLTLNEIEQNSNFMENELYYLGKAQYPDFFNKECSNIAKEMVRYNSVYTGKYFIDEINKTILKK